MKANKRSVWTIPTQATKGAHFATFSEQLPVDPIKASTSEYGCCAECGTPYHRFMEKELKPTHKAAKSFVVDGRDEMADKQSQGSNRQKDGHKPGHAYQAKTIGWIKPCNCLSTAITPAIVLDPFTGSGTTAIVALKLGRHFIGCELTEKYITEIAAPRLRKEIGMFLKLKIRYD